MIIDPFEEMRRIIREMDRMFGELTSRIPKEEFLIKEPAVDLIDEGDKFILVVELPGIRKEDIELYVTRDKVTIKAEKKLRKEDIRKGTFYVRERAYSTFYRVIQLPEPVIPEETKATFNNGVLEVELKKERPRIEGEDEGFKVKIE